MAGNIFGNTLRLTTFGESHGKATGGILEGFPSGIEMDLPFIQNQLSRRRPGQSALVTQRNETDVVEILSGVFEGKSLGTPIAFLVRNRDTRPQDYAKMRAIYRPSHADFTYQEKYGLRDYRGGGRSSARETVARVAAGAFAQLLLRKLNVVITAWTSQIGTVVLEKKDSVHSFEQIEASPVRCPDKKISHQMEGLVKTTASEGDSLGGVVSCLIKGVPIGWGEPVFDKLHADLGKAMLCINSVKGFEIGDGFAIASKKGSEVNDLFENKKGTIITATNHSGGIQGGISNGQDILFRVAFKPVATLMQKQNTVDEAGNPAVLEPKGRHDVCVVPRAVPIVEAMTALVLADHYLRNRTAKMEQL